MKVKLSVLRVDVNSYTEPCELGSKVINLVKMMLTTKLHYMQALSLQWKPFK